MLPIAGIVNFAAYRNIWFYSIFMPISSALVRIVCVLCVFYLVNEMAYNLFGKEKRKKCMVWPVAIANTSNTQQHYSLLTRSMLQQTHWVFQRWRKREGERNIISTNKIAVAEIIYTEILAVFVVVAALILNSIDRLPNYKEFSFFH